MACNPQAPAQNAVSEIGPVSALLAVIGIGIAARAWMLFSTPMVPGTNGGYYLVQARALLEAGRLGIPDLPLTFTLHAALAKAVQWLTGQSREASILLAVKLADSVLPPLVALPVYLLGRRWSAPLGARVWLPLAAAAVVALNPTALFITGDLQKNSLGLVWLAGLIYALWAWLTQRSVRNAAGVMALLGLAGLTHIGVFGVALLLTGLVLTVQVARPGGARDGSHWRVVGLGAGGGLVVAVVAGVVLWKFDPARIHRLARAVTAPADFFTSDLPPGRPPLGNNSTNGGPVDGTSTPPVAGSGFPKEIPAGAPAAGFRSFHLARWAPGVGFGCVAVAALVLLWRKRRDLPLADQAVVIGCAATVVLLTGPWVQGDMARRLNLIVMIPATIAGLFALQHLASRWRQSLLATVAVGWVLGPSLPLVARGGQPIISEAAYRELQTLRSRLSHPQRTLVVARHGLEWWTAWTLHTHIAQPKALRAADWTNYDEVLFLQSNGSEPGFDPPGRGFPAPMRDSPLPPDAEVLHEGPNFKLARVGTPPPWVRRTGP